MLDDFKKFQNKLLIEKLKQLNYNLVNEEIINSDLKKWTSIIYDKLDDKLKYHFDFGKISFNLIVNFKYDEEFIKYDGSTNIELAIENEYKDFIITVNVLDTEIQKNRLMSIITHELKHVIDSMDILKMLNSLQLDYNNQYIIYNNLVSSNMKEFLYLFYLTLNHEKDANEFMVYEYLRRFDFYDKDLMLETFANSSIYRIILKLKEFDWSKFINQYNNPEELLNDFKVFYKNVFNSDFDDAELIEIIHKYEQKFHKIYFEIIKNIEKIIDELIQDKKPYMEKYGTTKSPFNINYFNILTLKY